MSDEQQSTAQQPPPYDRLSARFAPSEHKTKTIGGTGLTYVDGETVVSRLNDALGFDGWSFEVKDVKILEDEVWALGRLTVYSGDRTVIREQSGGQIINRKRGTPPTPYRPAQEADGDRPAIPAVEAQPGVKGEVIELANDIKGAITDCLKKCATLVGVGLYLYDPNARTEVKAEMEAEKRAGPRPNASQAVNSGPRSIRSSGGGGSSTAATESDLEPYVCQECGGELTETQFRDGKTWSPGDLAGFGRRKFGRVLDMACYRKANDAKKRAEEGVAS